MRRSIRLAVPVAAVVAAGAAGACMNPELENRQSSEIEALSQTVNELKSYTNELETLLDSLHKVVLKQDTALRLIVDFTGAQVPSYRPPSQP